MSKFALAGGLANKGEGEGATIEIASLLLLGSVNALAEELIMMQRRRFSFALHLLPLVTFINSTVIMFCSMYGTATVCFNKWQVWFNVQYALHEE